MQPSALGSEVQAALRTIEPVMIRELDGNILYWNRAAERSYGFLQQQAIGNVSHLLLDTVFPEPLQNINKELLEKGCWEGELLHTLRNGEKVKVWSRWELRRTPDNVNVVETNGRFEEVRPSSAFLDRRQTRTHRFLSLLWRAKFWWLLPLVVTLVFFDLFFEVITPMGVTPLFE